MIGFIIDCKDVEIYLAAANDAIEEAKKVKVDIAILPIVSRCTMDEIEAAGLINLIKPSVVIPTHFEDIIGSKKNLEKFSSLIKSPIKIVVK
ncbi:MAG: MBL fold metallo-hydrolase [Elusimicrobiales bacterium]|nr:MBL fold metallo-hydrolase [Elusimicrobiales bacterium]